MRSHAVTKIDVPDNRVARDVDYHHVTAIGSGLAHARVTIDRHISGAAIGRCRDFVTGDATLWNNGDLSGRDGIDDAEVPILLVRDEQHSICLGFRTKLRATAC